MATRTKTRKRRPASASADNLKKWREEQAARKAEQEQAAAEGVSPAGDQPLEGGLAGVYKALQFAQQATNAQKAVSIVSEALGALDQETLDKVLSAPAVREIIAKAATTGKEPLKPGSYVRDSEGRVITKIPWRVEDVKREFPMVTFTPAETITLGWNGHFVQVQAFKEITLPACFHEVYMNHIRAVEEKEALDRKAGEERFGVGNFSIQTGWGQQEQQQKT